MRKQYLYSLVALVTLICYYYGLSLIQIPHDQEWTFVLLIFGGYSVLGFVFGFLFRRDVLTNFTLVFALGFLGAMLSIVSYRILLGPETLSQALQDLASLFIASFFIGLAAAVGTLANALYVRVLRRRARKGNNQKSSQTKEQPPQTAEVL